MAASKVGYTLAVPSPSSVTASIQARKFAAATISKIPAAWTHMPPARSRNWRARGFYSIIDGAFAAMLVMLSAVNEGLGAGFVAAFDDGQVRSVLGLPPEIRPIGIIPVGYCAEKPEKLARLPKEEIIHYARGAGCQPAAGW